MELIRSPSLWCKFLKNNGYTLHQCIGTGSFGDVFEVTKTGSSIRSALKRIVVRGKVTEDRYTMAEIDSLLKFDHPNIVALEEFFTRKHLACIILELASGGNLEVMVAKGGSEVNESFIQVSFRQLLSALDYCHLLDYAHRDINPSNVLVFNDNLVKLADFGLVFRCCDERTGSPVMCVDYLGQESYLAPEVKRRDPFSAKPADVWSLGCVLFFIVKKVNPPIDEHDFWTLMSAGNDELSSPSNGNGVSEDFTSKCLDIVKRMCSANVLDRPELPQLISVWDT